METIVSEKKEDNKQENTGYRSLYSTSAKDEDTNKEEVDDTNDGKESDSTKKFSTPDENIFTMSNKEKIGSVIHYGKAAGFDDNELQFLEMCLTFYWGY